MAQLYSDKNNYYDKLLILDEPTSYLDIKHQSILFDLLHSMNSKGLTILMVLHDLNHAMLHSKKTIMLKKSELIAFGKTDIIINEKNLSDVFDVNLKLISSNQSSKPIIVNLN